MTHILFIYYLLFIYLFINEEKIMRLEEFFSKSCVVGKHVQLFQFDLYVVEYTVEHYLNHQIDLMVMMLFVDALKKKKKKQVQVNENINDHLQKVKHDR